MPEAQKLVASVLDAYNRGDIAFIQARIAADCPWSGSLSPEVPYGGQFTGPAGAAKFFESIGTNIDVKIFEVERYVSEGEHVVALGNWSGVARKTGGSYSARFALYFQARGGKIIRFTGHEDTAVTAIAFRG